MKKNTQPKGAKNHTDKQAIPGGGTLTTTTQGNNRTINITGASNIRIDPASGNIYPSGSSHSTFHHPSSHWKQSNSKTFKPGGYSVQQTGTHSMRQESIAKAMRVEEPTIGVR
jgi:hypothetical protein